MNCAAFTSMDEKYYERCGRAMLRSYKKYWSDRIPLYVYNEDNFEIKVSSINSLGWNLGKEYEKFQSRHSNHKVKTFAKKGFSIIDAMHNLKYDRIMWLDADTIINAEMPIQLLELISADDILSTHFSVWHTEHNITYHSCETGFFIINRNHPGFIDFRNTYKDIYYNDRSEDIRRFYDGEVYGKTVSIMDSKGYKMLDLNPGRHKTPIGRSVIAPYISHYKAGLKDRIDLEALE